MAGKKKPFSFEEGLERLENIAGQMERGQLTLDELMKLYEEGVRLSGELTRKLDSAGSRMLEVRQGSDGQPVVENSTVTQQQNLLDEFE